MSSALPASRAQIIAGLCIPLAVLIGYFLAEPGRLSSVAILFLVLATLTFPLLMRWHHSLLVLSWNSTLLAAFLPGSPQLWMVMAMISMFIVVLNRAVSERHPVRSIPNITLALGALLLVVFVTALVTGGVGLRILGSNTYGGKGYFYIFAAAAGYFALANRRIDPARQGLYVAMFFLPGLLALLSNLAFAAGESFWWLFYILPAKVVGEQLIGAYALDARIVRLGGLSAASLALYYWCTARYGIRGLFEWHRPWRMGLYVLAWVGCFFCGFRSVLALFILVFSIQFVLEGLQKSRLMLVMIGAMLVLGGIIISDAQKLPMVVQRTISFLPVKVSHIARASAQDSTEWRLDMWRALLPEVPKYLLKGKGYAIDPNDLQMSMESRSRGGAQYLTAETAGDYHNGPLSIVIPFGIWGVLAFTWFVGASLRYLYANFRRGDPKLHRTNTFLFTLFLAKTVFFVLVFGSFHTDLAAFAGIVGFSACLNGQVATEMSNRVANLVQEPAVVSN